MSRHYQFLLLISLIAIIHAAYADHSHNKTHDHGHSHNQTHSHDHNHTETHSHNKTNRLGHDHSHNHSKSDHHGSAPTMNETALQEKCDMTGYPASCLAVARSDAHKYHNIDYKAMLDMMVAAAKKNVDLTGKAAAVAAVITGLPGSRDKNLKECPGGFKYAHENIKAAKAAIAEGDGNTAAINLSAALDNAGRCDDILKERPTAQANPIKTQIESIKEIISCALTFTYSTFNIPQPN